MKVSGPEFPCRVRRWVCRVEIESALEPRGWLYTGHVGFRV